LLISNTGIHYIHSSIKFNNLYIDDNCLYHIPKCVIYNSFSSYGIKNYKQEREKLDTIGEEAYYKEIDEICEKMYEESYNKIFSL